MAGSRTGRSKVLQTLHKSEFEDIVVGRQSKVLVFDLSHIFLLSFR
jgi:hypothetical protein